MNPYYEQSLSPLNIYWDNSQFLTDTVVHETPPPSPLHDFIAADVVGDLSGTVVPETEDQIEAANAWICAMEIEDRYRVRRQTSAPPQIYRRPLAAVMKCKKCHPLSAELVAEKPSMGLTEQTMLEIYLPCLFRVRSFLTFCASVFMFDRL